MLTSNSGGELRKLLSKTFTEQACCSDIEESNHYQIKVSSHW